VFLSSPCIYIYILYFNRATYDDAVPALEC